MNRSRRGSNSNSHSCGEENEVENVVGDSRRSKKSASAEPFAISSNDSATGSTGSIDRGKKKKFSFWSNLFKSKISEKDENEVIGLSSSYESVNSAASTNSFAFVSPKKYKGKGGHKGKRIPVDEQTLPRTAKERDGSLPRGRSRNGGAGGGNKMGTLSRIGMKMGLKKKYNLQSCESLEHIVTTAPVVQPFSRGSKSSAVVEKGQWRLPPLNKSSSSKQSGSNGTDLPKLDPLVNDHNVLPPVEKASSSKQSETSATELPSEISDLSKSDPVEKYQSGLSVEKASSSKQAFSNGNRLSLKVPEINKSPEKVIGLPPKSEEPFPSTSQSQANKVEEGNKVPAEIPIPVTDSSPLQMSSEYDSGTWTNSRGKRRAPAPPNNLKGSTRNNNVIEIPGNKSSKEAEEGNVELKSVTRVGERNEMEKRESYPSGALRRNKSSSRDKFPSRPCSCSSSIFAHHSKYQPRKYGHCSSENCCNNNSNYNSKTRTHVKGKKKAPPPPNPFGDPDAPEELPQIKNIPQSKNEIAYGNANCTKVSSQIQPEPSKEINKTPIESTENSKKVSKTQSQPEPCKEVIKNQNVPKSSSEETKASSAAQKGSENSSDLSEGSKTKPVEFREFAHLSCSKTATVEAQPASEEISPKNSKIHPTVRLSMGNGESGHVVAAGPSRENHENRNEEARSLERHAMTLEAQPSTENGTSTSSAIVLEESQDEAAQNALNDRQEKEQQLLTSNEVTVQPSSPTSVTLSSDVEVTPAVAGPSTSSTTKATGSTKNRLFNFSSKRNSRESEKMTEKDLQDAENELQALLHSSGTLKAEAKKVDEQVKAQLVELKKESDKSPLMFFGSKSKKSSSTTGNSSKEIPGTSASSSPIPSCSSPEPEQRVTPRPWYKRSISISSSSKSPTGSKPKIPPKPTIKMQMLPKFSELDREAQKIVEENRRKSAEIAFNENARELINMFNTTFSPTAEDISAESENQENSSRNLQSQSLPTSSSDAGDNNVTPSSSCSMQSPATKTSISASSKPVTTNLQSDEQKNVAVVQPQSKQIQIQAKSQPSSLVAPITLASTNAPNSWTIAPITSVNTPIAKISTNSSSSAITPTTLTTTPITKASTSTLTPVLSATVVPSVRGSTAVTTVSSSVTSNRNVTSVATPVPKISSAAAVPASSTTTTMITLQGSSAISLSTNPGTTTTTNSTSVTSPPSTKSPEPEWSCSRCTLKNSPWRALCEACYCRKDSPSLANPITSIFERVNANKSNTSTSASGNIINSKPVYVSAGSNGSASSTTEISKKPMQLVRPKSSASPACENFLSQLPSKEALGKEEKLQGMKLNAIEDPEVEELDIEKLRKARLAFFDKEQKSKVKKSLDKPNNLAVCSSSSGSSGKDFTRLKANVFSDGEDDSIDSLLQLNTNNSVNGNSSKRSETSSKNNNNNASASSPPGVVEPVSASVTAAKVQQPKPQGTVTVPVVAGQFRFRPMLESIFESDSNYYSTGEFERIYENWQLKEQMQNSLDENDDETISEGPTSTFMQFPLSVDSMQRRLQGRNKMEQNINMQTTNQVHVAENANMNVMRVDLPSASFSNFRSFNNPVVYPAQSSSYPVVYTNPVVGSANANGSYPHQQHRVYSPIESDANYFYLKDNNNSGSSSDAEGQNMEREGRRTRGQRNSIGQREQRQLSYEDYRKLGAVPKGYFNDFPDERSVVSSGSDSGRQDYFSDREQSRRRSSNGNGSRRRQSRGDDEARYFNEPSAESFSSEYNTMAVGKLLRRLEMAIGMGEHRLAATLAHDLALLKVNCVVAKPNKEPITIRVYVEDRFMQQGPFQVQVLQTMTLRELKLKVEGDWGIPCGFQKWILGKKMAEDDCETLNFYEVVNDTMAFLYLVTPQIEKKSNSPRPKPKEPSPPPIPSKPSNNVNMMAIGLQSHSTSIQNDTRKNAASPIQINATKKSSDDDTNNASNKNSADEPVVSLYRKPLPPASATDFNNVQKKTPESTETMPIPTPMPIPRVRTASTSRDTPERNVSSTVNSNQQQLPLLRMTKDHSSSPKPENKPQEVSNSQKSSQNLSSNSQLSQNIDTELVSKLKAKSPTHSNIINNIINNPTAGGNNFPISLQQKLANLREAAEQAFGKSFGQTSGNSEQKQNIPTKSSPEIKIKSKSASENVVKNSVRVGPDSSSVIRHNAAVNKEIQSQNQSTRKAGHESIKTQVEIKENAGIAKNIPAIKLSNADVPITKNFSKDTKNEATLANSNAEIQAKTNKICNSVEAEKSPQSSRNPTPAIQANANNNISSEIPSISSVEVEVNISEPRPKPRARKQNLSESSGDSLKNEKVTLGNVKEESPTNITSTVDKVEVIITKSTDVQKVPTTGKVKSDGSCQTTLAFPLPKSPVVVRNVSEEKPACNSQNVTLSPGNKSPSSNQRLVLKSPSPTTSLQNGPDLRKGASISPQVNGLKSPSPVHNLITEASTTSVKSPSVKSSENASDLSPKKSPLSPKNGPDLAKVTLPALQNQNELKPMSPVLNNIAEASALSSPVKSPENVAVSTTDLPPKKITASPIKALNLPSSPTISQIPVDNESEKKLIVNSSKPPVVPIVAQPPLQTGNKPLLPVSSNPMAQVKSVTPPSRGPLVNNLKNKLGMQQQSDLYKTPCFLNSNSSPRPFKSTTGASGGITGVVFQGPSSQLKSAPVLSISCSPPVQNGMTTLQRKNSDSSIINVDFNVSNAENTSSIEGAAALPDDKKEDNIQTYLSMLQLMEKQDLIMTSEAIECPVCFLLVPPGEGVTLRDCLHNFCKECLIGAVQYAEDSEVKCPFRDTDYSCNSSLQEREIKALVPGEIFEKYLANSVKLAERKMMNTFHCKTNDCTGWCVFEDDVNSFNCPVCKKRNCLTCAAIHENMDCQQYQRELAIASETDENAKSSRLMLEKMIQRGEALECPACHVVLLKKWGCDWVRCSYCKTEICWVTKGFRWGPGGKGDMSGGCKCGVNGVRCHPRCTYCH